MSLQELRPNIKKNRKRVGRGNASGHGTYCCRGMNGQNSRSGGRRRPGFEGGQTPFIQKMPKLKGFKNINQVRYQVVKTDALNIFNDGEKVDIETLLEKRLISKKQMPVKLLKGREKLEKKLEIVLHKASATAQEEVKATGGSLTLLSPSKSNETSKTK